MKPNTESVQNDPIEEASAWCVRLADGCLSEQAQTEFDAWRAVPENARAFDDVAGTWQSLEATSTSPELIDMRRDALESFRRSHASQWNRITRHRHLFIALAAGVAVVLIATLLLHLAPLRYETGIGERLQVALSDGSMISLDAQSRVDVRYRDDRRELRLVGGRAKFDVARDPLRPFTVTAADKIVVATGTQFSVEVVASQVHVILYHGSVDLFTDAAGEKPKPVQVKQRASVDAPRHAGATLAPGEEMISTTQLATAEVKLADLVRSAAWETGQLVFTDETLEAAVERMNRYARTPLLVGDARAAAIRISGVYAAGDTDAFVEGITGVFPVRIEVSGGQRAFVSVR
ncbi:FecR family protein [Peristeroidobacter soli]|jgi:transmembrane sensor|uniref:FecR family protein n=1 Tax=Peristeroidobacter soli TaxID=2497877 RepID=UPI00101DF0B4|nr:FecR domain-containing protein [Peristeroidobacter soli]